MTQRTHLLQRSLVPCLAMLILLAGCAAKTATIVPATAQPRLVVNLTNNGTMDMEVYLNVSRNQTPIFNSGLRVLQAGKSWERPFNISTLGRFNVSTHWETYLGGVGDPTLPTGKRVYTNAGFEFENLPCPKGWFFTNFTANYQDNGLRGKDLRVSGTMDDCVGQTPPGDTRAPTWGRYT